MNRAELLRTAVAKLAAAGIENPRLEARVLFEHVQAGTVGGGDDRQALFHTLVARRAAREPLAYVIGRKEFWSLDFEVGPGALVPRPETETLVEEALRAFPDRSAPLRILDLGTGSGCLLVTALSLYPQARGTGLDRSPAALAWAHRNAARHGVADRATWIEGDWEAARPGPYDLVLANPPYIASAEMPGLGPELRHEPASALESGPEGLEAYRALGPLLAAVLAPEGVGLVEIGAGQGPAVSAILGVAGLEIRGLVPDLSGIPRVVSAGRDGLGPATFEKSVGNRGPGL